jgi:F0F1-type ATP synthase beta subunit
MGAGGLLPLQEVGPSIFRWESAVDPLASTSRALTFSVAQVFTGREGKQVAVADTVRGFKEILDGKHDDVPEANFYMKGPID